MFEPAALCPQVSVVSRWGWPKQAIKEENEDYSDRIKRSTKAAAKRLGYGYLNFPNDFSVRVKTPGARVIVMQRVVCVYLEEEKDCRTALAAAKLDWEVRVRPRASFGEEFSFMLNMIDNPGFIVIADHGLNQFCWMDDVPGQPDPTPEMVTARISFALRCAVRRKASLLAIRHQKSDGEGVLVKGMPPVSTAAATGYVNFNPPPGMGDFQQIIFVGAHIKAKWRPWSSLEDKAFALDERRHGGVVALYEGLTVRFGETQLMADRFNTLEHVRNQNILKREYPFLRFKRKGAKHHG
jgi:hypothetical protein